MSDFGEEIISRLNPNSSLHNEDNPMRKIILNTVGEWLEKYNDKEFYEQLFLATAKEDYLDLHGITYNVYRRAEENDEDYLQRIVYESISHLTSNYINDVYDLGIYVDVIGLEEEIINTYPHSSNIKLTSDNMNISSENGYFILLNGNDDIRKNSLSKKMVLGSRIKWAIL